MHPEFWHQRWADNQIGFHQDTPTPLLLKHWPALDIPAGAQVFVPLAGKSLDMAWFAAQGYRVLGVELSQLAIEQFFVEHGLQPDIRESKYGRHYSANGIELICGDAFALDAQALHDCVAVFDRAALIALPPELRQRYAREVYAKLPADCSYLPARTAVSSRPMCVAGTSTCRTDQRRDARMAHSTSSQPHPVKAVSKASASNTSRRTSRLEV